MKDVFGIICAGSESEQLRTLISRRDVASVPIGGRYRVIDFLLSNMVNSNIHDVGLITRRNCQSIMDHVGTGKDWDLDRKNGGLFILPPYTSTEFDSPRGMLDEVKNATGFIDRERLPYCIICKASLLYNHTFDKMFQQHLETGADITIMYNEEPFSDAEATEQDENFVIKIDENQKIYDVQYAPTDMGFVNRSMECVLMRKETLKYLLQNAYSRNKHNMLVDVIKNNLSNLKVYGYKYEGYFARLTTVQNYFKASLDMLNPEILRELFYTGNNIYTRTKDEPPTHYGKDAKITNSLIATGCVIDGEVENSIIFRGVHIGKHVKIKDSVVFQNSKIYDHSTLEKAIIDKDVTVRSHSTLSGSISYPVVIPKGGVV